LGHKAHALNEAGCNVGEVWDRGKQGFQETDIENNGGAAR
jgi:hypothetical protein